MDNEKSLKRKNAIARISIISVIVLSAIYCVMTLIGGYNWFGWFLAIANLVAGPACLIAYIIEVRKGVFRDDSENKERISDK